MSKKRKEREPEALPCTEWVVFIFMEAVDGYSGVHATKRSNLSKEQLDALQSGKLASGRTLEDLEELGIPDWKEGIWKSLGSAENDKELHEFGPQMCQMFYVWSE